MSQRPAPTIFLDRDGTINIEKEYLSRPEQLVLIEGAAEGIRMLREADFRIVVVTNQSGVARGYFPEERVILVNSVLESMLRKAGAEVDAWYFCPHHPEHGKPPYRASCRCRKPGPGMVEQAHSDFPVDFGKSFVIGDTMRDMELAWNCGMWAVLVKTGHGAETVEKAGNKDISRIDFISDHLLQAAEWICSKQGRRT